MKKGDAIPSVRKLALELDVTPGTVAKAYREMEQSGMIETIRGKGTFMADIPFTARNEGVIRKMKTEIEKNCMELIYQGQMCIRDRQIRGQNKQRCDSRGCRIAADQV